MSHFYAVPYIIRVAFFEKKFIIFTFFYIKQPSGKKLLWILRFGITPIYLTATWKTFLILFWPGPPSLWRFALNVLPFCVFYVYVLPFLCWHTVVTLLLTFYFTFALSLSVDLTVLIASILLAFLIGLIRVSIDNIYVTKN